ncbi:hypothetical protein F5890DRAFT_402321 [Lentinula detonsa]|uniref:Uncharacterized protein n=1 Tax=Lentinula detonsa TaxID=2804962 RepID=A0AA38UQJ8_9AGAR|nr:hypothetical protein F5890DRAFT_402321 [Lentinula detonsa]
MMLIRIKAIYSGNKIITSILVGILLVETGINAWLISRGEPVRHNPSSSVHACTMIFDPAISTWASASAWIPLIYDTVIFALTMHRTIPELRSRDVSFVIKRIFDDGLIYYSVIFSVNAILTVMILAAPAGIKNIAAQTEQLMTVAMMSRITTNLKKAGQLEEIYPARLGVRGANFSLQALSIPSIMTTDLQFASMEESISGPAP